MNKYIRRLIRQSVKKKGLSLKNISLRSTNQELIISIQISINRIAHSLKNQYSHNSKMSMRQREIANQRIIRLNRIIYLLKTQNGESKCKY